MDSESVGAIIDNGDLSGRERGRWGDKVYTRRKFRNKGKLGISINDSATNEPFSVATDPTANTKVSSSSPAKDDLATSGSPLQPSLEGTLDAKEGHSPNGEGQPVPSRSEGGPSTSDGVRQPEDDSRGGDVVPSGGEGPHPLRVGVDREVLGDGQKSTLNGEGEPPSSRDREALSQPLPNGGQNAVPNGGEKQSSLSRNGPESSSELQHTGEQESLPGITRSRFPIALVDAQTTTAQREEAATATKSNKELRVTLPMDEGSHVRVDGHMNGMVTTGLVNGLSKPMIARVDDRVRIDITVSRPRDEMRNLKRKLEHELEQVKSLAEKLQAKELQLTAYMSEVNANTRYVSGIDGYSQLHLARATTELGEVENLYSRPRLDRAVSDIHVGYQDLRPFRHLSVSVGENNHIVNEFVEKEKQEKRTPKANQFYRNSEFLLGKDRLPPETNKRLKLNYGGKKHGSHTEYRYGYPYQNRDKVFKSCSNLLQRLMKHKHGWVFNEPVDAKKLNIPDYHLIIKSPMDLGTIKTRVAQNLYKSAREFAEDVRLVFRNAMTYNPKGQDVHTMAEELSNIFEEKWMAIEKEYYPYQTYYDAGLPINTPRKAPPPVFTHVPTPVLTPPSVPPMRALDISDSIPIKPSNSNPSHGGRTAAPKKPKAKDPNKRDMTYEEKQKLSLKLQSLPPEKFDAIVQIIKKRSTALSQHDDEIEVDIDSVDAETLWELDRFVTNYKKSLSKNKRKAELALKRRAEAAQAAQMNPSPAVVKAQTENRTGDKINPLVVEVEKKGDNASGSSSSSSSSSDSGSSSSDSDSDSSSADGSDGDHSPKS